MSTNNLKEIKSISELRRSIKNGDINLSPVNICGLRFKDLENHLIEKVIKRSSSVLFSRCEFSGATLKISRSADFEFCKFSECVFNIKDKPDIKKISFKHCYIACSAFHTCKKSSDWDIDFKSSSICSKIELIAEEGACFGFLEFYDFEHMESFIESVGSGLNEEKVRVFKFLISDTSTQIRDVSAIKDLVPKLFLYPDGTEISIPEIQNFKRKLAKFLSKKELSLEMSSFHGGSGIFVPENPSEFTPECEEFHEEYCGTTHCIAGHATNMAGKDGIKLESIFWPDLAATLIAEELEGFDFYQSNKSAISILLEEKYLTKKERCSLQKLC